MKDKSLISTIIIAIAIIITAIYLGQITRTRIKPNTIEVTGLAEKILNQI